MQTLNAAHLANLRQALAILSRGLKQNSVLLESEKLTLKAFKPVSEESTQPQAPVSAEAVKKAPAPVQISKEAAKVLRLSSSGFFCRLPWSEAPALQKDSIAPVRPQAAPVEAQTAPSQLIVEESKPASYSQAGEVFFRKISWHKPTAAINRERLLKPSGAYFKAIFGGEDKVIFSIEAPKRSSEEALFSESGSSGGKGPKDNNSKSGGYFEALPWGSNQKPLVASKSISAAEQPDAGWMGQLAMQSALRTAERMVAERKNPLSSMAGIYFREIFIKPKQAKSLDEPRKAGIIAVRGLEKAGALNSQMQPNEPVLEKVNSRYFQNLPWN